MKDAEKKDGTPPNRNQGDNYIYDGPRAFPYAAVHGCNGEYGMTLRDYFAAHMMGQVLVTEKGVRPTWTMEDYAAHCYEAADAMLKEREK